jgi:trk system potassium uptake protein TrkA
MFRKKATAKQENILILGLGGMGFYLAKRLQHEGYSVTAIEPDSKLINYADANLDSRFINGSALSIERWREANAEEMDYMIAVTNKDALNMMGARIADRFGIPQKICRLRNQEFGKEDLFRRKSLLPGRLSGWSSGQPAMKSSMWPWARYR